VALRVVQPGQHCQTVEIRDNRGAVLASARSCITGVQPSPLPSQPKSQPKPSTPAPTFPAPSAEKPPAGTAPAAKLPAPQGKATAKITGPTTRTVGETAEFSLEVTNAGLQALENLKVAVRLDEQLDPSMASGGYQWEKDNLVWTLATLAAGQTMKYQIHARAVLPTEQACVQVQVRDQQSTLAQDRTCVRIRPAPGTGTTSQAALPGLSLTVADRHDPVTVGKELTYDIEVSNTGQTPCTNVVLLVNVPSEMTPVPLQTTGPSSHVIEAQTVRVSPVAQLGPLGRLTYRVRVLAKKEGTAFIQAEVSAQGLSPVIAQEKTTINAR